MKKELLLARKLMSGDGSRGFMGQNLVQLEGLLPHVAG